jgi:hypothetical protein
MKTLRRACKTAADWEQHVKQCELRQTDTTRHVGLIGNTITESVDTMVPPLPFVVTSFFDATGKKWRERKGRDIVEKEEKIWYHILFGMGEAATVVRMAREIRESLEEGEELPQTEVEEQELGAVEMSPEEAKRKEELEAKERELQKKKAAALANSLGLDLEVDPEEQ